MKTNNFYNDVEHELTKSGDLKKPSILFSPKLAMVVTILAVIIDASSIFISIDPLLKGNFFFNVLITATTALVLDYLPSYFAPLISKYNYYKSIDKVKAKMNFLLLSMGIIVILSTFTILFAFRYGASDFILESTYTYYETMASVSETSPVFTEEIASILMTILNVVNIGSTFTVFVVWFFVTPSEGELEASALVKRTITLSKMKDEQVLQRERLKNVVDYNADDEEQKAYVSINDLLKREKEVERRRAINDLAATLNDADCTQYILNTASTQS